MNSTQHEAQASPAMSILTKESLAESEVILNRTNLALARSRKLIESWMPPPDSADNEPNKAHSDDDDEDFKPESETAGLGSKVHLQQENDILSSDISRNRSAGKDKLLQQILGKKGAREHLKSKRPASKDEASKKKDYSRNSGKRSRDHDDSEDDEESRTTMISKRKTKR